MKRQSVRLLKVLVVLVIASIGSYKTLQLDAATFDNSNTNIEVVESPAGEALATLPIKGRAPKTGYSRDQFGNGWSLIGECDARNYILARDLVEETLVTPTCKVATGRLNDPYSGKIISFFRGADTSDDIQIDHVVALSDAWQKGAQALTVEQRRALANDPLELLAVEGALNQQKSDGDAATWLPPNKSYRCAYVARQIAIKKKYSLWVTRSEYDTMADVLKTCPDQLLPTS
jgi:hypothetical protein